MRFAGNLAVAAFFAGENERQRQLKRDELVIPLTAYLNGDVASKPAAEEKALRSGPRGVTPFHWEIEFPEVFGRENPGFDCIVGNPPFLGGTMISTHYSKGYLAFLYTAFPESGNRMDLVAYFFRRAFGLLRSGGTFGLIATNTIAQGDTRQGGLRWICTHNGCIYAAQRRYKWPGEAAVIVSVLHIAKNHQPSAIQLDGKSVRTITAFLFHAGGHESPCTLAANSRRSGSGSKIYGQGFLFADDKACTPIAEMGRLIESNPRNQERIFPYIGGEEVNDSPTHAHHRYVINFSEMTENEARQWPDLMRIVEEKVKPERDAASAEVQRCPWWQHFRSRPELYAAMRTYPSALVNSQVSAHHAFAFLPSTWVYAHTLNVFALSRHAAFCVLQSRVHEVWARFFGSSMKDDLRYTPSDCFETFPFPDGFETHPQLEAAGKVNYEFRAALMVRNNEGLTKTYNRFHDPHERSADILQLRELHAAMDRAVLDAYGWTDLKPTCEFLLDYEDEEDEDEGGRRRRKKPWRYRWPDEFRDEVLARLLDLNKQRAEQEQLAGTTTSPKPRREARKRNPPAPDDGGLLFRDQ